MLEKYEKRFKDGRMWLRIDGVWEKMAFPGEVQAALGGHEIPPPAGFFSWRRRREEKAKKEKTQKTILTPGDIRRVWVRPVDIWWFDETYSYADPKPIIRQIIKHKVHKIPYVPIKSDCDDIAIAAWGVGHLIESIRDMAFFFQTIAWKDKRGEYLAHALLSIITPEGHKLLEPHKNPKVYDFPPHVKALRMAG